MKQHGGVWLPDGETHLTEWMTRKNRVVDGKLTYQYHKLEAALGFVRNFRTAIDIGAHCGLWSMHLAKRFERLSAFEPVAAHRECFYANLGVNGILPEHVFMYDCALGNHIGRVAMKTAPSSSGDTTVAVGDEVPIRKLDEFEFRNVDFVKLDCEGYELFALRGGIETLERCRPVVCVEQKPGKASQFGLPDTGAVEFLQGLGAKLRGALGGDYILSWD